MPKNVGVPGESNLHGREQHQDTPSFAEIGEMRDQLQSLKNKIFPASLIEMRVGLIGDHATLDLRLAKVQDRAALQNIVTWLERSGWRFSSASYMVSYDYGTESFITMTGAL